MIIRGPSRVQFKGSHFFKHSLQVQLEMTQGTVDPNSTEPLWMETPLLYSSHLSETLGSSVYLKLEV